MYILESEKLSKTINFEKQLFYNVGITELHIELSRSVGCKT